MQREQVRNLEQVLQNVDEQRELVVDARAAGRFQGTAPELRAGMRGGHIPHSKNVPFDSVMSDGRLACWTLFFFSLTGWSVFFKEGSAPHLRALAQLIWGHLQADT